MKLKKYDYIIIIFLAIITVLSIAIPFLTKKDYTDIFVTLQVNGDDYKSFPLNKDTTIPLKIDDTVNLIEIKDSKVHISDANCPDKLCVKDGWISKPGQILVCLPHKVVVQIKGSDEQIIDESTY